MNPLENLENVEALSFGYIREQAIRSDKAPASRKLVAPNKGRRQLKGVSGAHLVHAEKTFGDIAHFLGRLNLVPRLTKPGEAFESLPRSFGGQFFISEQSV